MSLTGFNLRRRNAKKEPVISKEPVAEIKEVKVEEPKTEKPATDSKVVHKKTTKK